MEYQITCPLYETIGLDTRDLGKDIDNTPQFDFKESYEVMSWGTK